MRKLAILLSIFPSLIVNSQHNNEFYNDGALVHVQAGAEVHIWGDMHMLKSTGNFQNNGLVKVEGNAYSDNLFQQSGTGTLRMDNTEVNTAERQFISGSYAVRGGQSQIGVNDGSFYLLELANRQGVVYLVGTGNIADVRSAVNFNAGPIVNRIITHDIGMTGAIVNPVNGSNYTGIFGLMNSTAGIANLVNNTISTNGNMSGVDNAFVQGKFRRSINAGGGNYEFVLGLEPAGAGAKRGVQYSRIDFGANNYDVITGYFQSSSPNNFAPVIECSGSSMDYFGGADHGEWMFSDRTGTGTGTYAYNVWPQDHNFITASLWGISKDNSFQGTANQCGPTTVGLTRGGFNGFNAPSEFDVVAAISPLPVELIKIWAEPKGNHIAVNWDVATEHNVSHYELERAENITNFANIASIDAAGHATSELHYSFDDYEVQRNKNYYYRYKSVDFDGAENYSPIVIGRISGSGADFNDGLVSIYPNPTSADVNLAFEFETNKNINIAVFNSIGQVIYETTLELEKGYTVVPVDSGVWSMGMYTIKIVDSLTDQVIWKKFIKN